MRTFPQLAADEQARAVQFQLNQVAVDPSLLADAAIAAKLQTIATKRARAALYLDPDDQIVTLPPPPIVTGP